MRAFVVRWTSFCLAAALLIGATSGGLGETRDVAFAAGASGTVRSLDLIGVNTHFGTVRVLGYTSAQTALSHIDELGATAFRDYLPWYSFKFPKSGTVFDGSRRLVKFLADMRGLTPLLNLGGTFVALPGGVPPISDQALNYFDLYVRKAVAETEVYRPIYEIWNEWNMQIGTGERMPAIVGEGAPTDPRNAKNYVRLVKVAMRAAKEANPQARVVVGAVGDDIDWVWARAIVRYGVLAGAEGLSVHLYNQCGRVKTADEMIDRVTRLQSMLTADRGVETPIYVTEFGWPTSKGDCGMPYDVTAYNFAHFVLQAATVPWIKGIWMHELKNIGQHAGDRENNYGLYTFDDKPKPAVCFMKQAIAIVRAADRVELERPFRNVFVLRATTGDSQKIVMWTSSEATQVTYRLSRALEGRAMCGADIRADGGERLELGPAPVIYEAPDLGALSIRLTS